MQLRGLPVVLLLLLVVVGAAEADEALCDAVEALRSRLWAAGEAFNATLGRKGLPRAKGLVEEPPFEPGYNAKGKAPWTEAVAAFARLGREVSSFPLLTQERQASRRHVAELSLAQERLREVAEEVQLLRRLVGAVREHVGKMAALRSRRDLAARRLADAGKRLQQQQHKQRRRQRP